MTLPDGCLSPCGGVHTCHVVHPAIVCQIRQIPSFYILNFLLLKSCFIDWVEGYKSEGEDDPSSSRIICPNVRAPKTVCKYTATPRRKKYTLSSVFCLLFLAVLLLQKLIGASEGGRRCDQIDINIQYLHQAFGSLKEVLPTLRLRALLMPVDDCLIRHAVLVVQDLQKRDDGSEHLTSDLHL